MILLDEFISLNVSPEFLSLFLVVVQLGAILAVPVLFWERLNPFSRKKQSAERRKAFCVWGRVAVGAMPAAILGLLMDDYIDSHFFNFWVVALALVFYGIVFIFVEKNKADEKNSIKSIDEMTYIDALKIGAFQSLSLIPGTSRSGSTIIGGMLIGISREASAEFSFFMAIPIMLGASLLKVIKFLISGFSATADEMLLLLVGSVVSFIVSILAIRFLMDYVKHNDFKPFGIYRIVLGFVVLIYFVIQVI